MVARYPLAVHFLARGLFLLYVPQHLLDAYFSHLLSRPRDRTHFTGRGFGPGQGASEAVDLAPELLVATQFAEAVQLLSLDGAWLPHSKVAR